MRLTRYSFVILAVVLAVSAFPAAALGQTNSSDADVAAVATITQMENSSIRADLAERLVLCGKELCRELYGRLELGGTGKQNNPFWPT
jgi:hypothetical protein